MVPRCVRCRDCGNHCEHLAMDPNRNDRGGQRRRPRSSDPQRRGARPMDMVRGGGGRRHPCLVADHAARTQQPALAHGHVCGNRGDHTRRRRSEYSDVAGFGMVLDGRRSANGEHRVGSETDQEPARRRAVGSRRFTVSHVTFSVGLFTRKIASPIESARNSWGATK